MRRVLGIVFVAATLVVGLSVQPWGTPAEGAASRNSRKIAKLETRAAKLAQRIRTLEKTADRFDTWLTCISYVPVSEFGKDDQETGFRYDAGDRTGVSVRPALGVDPTKPSLVFLTRKRSRVCESATTQPGGTADAARVAVAGSKKKPSINRRLTTLTRKARRMERRIDGLTDMADRFDEWESCLTWVPVTQFGDLSGGFGYAVSGGFRSAVAIDNSPWDDPDYQLLSFEGKNRPFKARACQEGSVNLASTSLATQSLVSPAAKRTKSPGKRIKDIDGDLSAIAEDVSDLVDPVESFTFFDECMFTVGASRRTGLTFVNAQGKSVAGSALDFDLAAAGRPDYDLMAFPGEEPPQIECNEDAGGLDTDE
ncbi:hypothetical protein BH09ACT10_BH09ACT10_24270 [soil metagenome]